MKALILIDFINDILNRNSNIEEFEKINFFEKLNETIKKAREKGFLIIHVKVGFSHNYIEKPNNSPLFGQADKYGILKLGSEGTNFYKKIEINEEDIIIEKNRVSAFYSTHLDLILKTNNIQDIFISGIATELTVSSTTREAHDRNYNVTVLKDLCIGNPETNESELKILSRIASIKNSNEIF